jgi:hypothetical protein
LRAKARPTKASCQTHRGFAPSKLSRLYRDIGESQQARLRQC